MATNITSGKPSVLIQRASSTLVVAVYGDDSPSDEEWQHYVKVIESLDTGYRMIIFSSGGGPTTMQRRDLEKITEGQDTAKVAVVTVSRLARGIVTAIRWFNREIKAFEPSERQRAFEFLELSKGEGQTVLTLAKGMADELGVAERLLLVG